MRDIPPEFGPTVPTGEYLDVRDEALRLREELDEAKAALRASEYRNTQLADQIRRMRLDMIDDAATAAPGRYALYAVPHGGPHDLYRIDTVTGQVWRWESILWREMGELPEERPH